MKFAAVALFTALSASTASALSITNPSASSWWVANSVNLLSWSCHDSDATGQYTVIIFGPGSLEAGLPIIAQMNNYDCSETIPANGNFPAGNNYTIALANPLNRTDILASTPFTIEAQGSAYPTSASPTASATISATNTGTSSGAPTTSTTSTKSGAESNSVVNSAIISGIAFVVSCFMARPLDLDS
ncbi:hypothetical protein DL93DRAFT_2162796 [Clavulina sp. PMI_390]|nr:hypothetical protein DL93DRAFT_2162796 [Clavulina sp. PMI_390]